LQKRIKYDVIIKNKFIFYYFFMRKLLVFTLIVLLFWISSTFAWWYPAPSKNYTLGGTTACTWDGLWGGTDATAALAWPVNVSAPTTWLLNCSYWDWIAPTWAVSYSTTAWTNWNVVVTVSCSDIWWSLCSATTYSKTVASNWSWTIPISDNAWNISSIPYNVTNIDTIAPTWAVSYSTTAWINGVVIVTASCSDTWWSWCSAGTFSQSVNSNLSSTITISDNAWNTSSIPYNVTNIDTAPPSAPTINSTTHTSWTWSNNINPNITVSPWIGGPSPVTTYYCFDTLNTCTPNSTTIPNHSNLSDWVHYFRVNTCDTWGCSATSIFTLKIDTKPPNINNIWAWGIGWWSENPAKNSNLLATSSQLFSVTVWINWWSLITRIEWYFENYTKIDWYVWSTLDSSNNWTLTITKNIQNVDLNRINGSRQYSFKITKVCDQVNICWTWNKIFNYNVYANTNSINTNILSGQNNFTSGNKVADWSINTLNFMLQDTYWNQIVPATWVNRTIDFNFDVNNSNKLDQYQGNLDAIFLTTPNNFIYTNKLWITTTFFNQWSSTWTYPFNFKVYAPTYNSTATDGRQYVNGSFKINNITYNINQNIFPDKLNQNVLNSNIIFQFKPIYYTTLSWPIKDFWFIEWATQSWIINISKNWNKTTTLNKINIEFWSWTKSPSPNFDMTFISPSLLSWPVWEWNPNYTTFENNLNIWNHNLTTLITQTWVLANLNSSYLSTHILYNIDWKQVVYNSAILWKTRYDSTTSSNTVTQVWLKVLWRTFSDKQTNITVNQQSSNFNILWSISKASLKKDIVLNAYNIIKNITPANGWNKINDLSNNTWNNADWKKLQNDNILYFWWLNWWKVVLDTNGNWLANPTELIWKKTIVIKWWNLYIKSNIVNKTNNDILWIIVLKDINGKWWKVYIDPAVGEINAIIYADRSIISYDWIKELDWSTPQIVLKNQLYLYGSIFSNNTIWWSRANPLICPYYITWLCDSIIAQTYDFNYLRRYFLYTNTLWNTVPANWGINVFLPADPNYKYPIIIKYNPVVQTSPPPLFYK